MIALLTKGRLRLLLVVLLLLTSRTNGQQSAVLQPLDALYRHGIQLSLDSTSDLFAVGELGRTAGTAETWFDLSLDWQPQKVFPLFARSDVFLSLHTNGNWNSGIGKAVQTISGIQSHPGFYVAEIWVEKAIASRLRLRLGKIDGNRDFGFIEDAMSFVNTAEGYSPSFFLLPNYNATQPGAELLMNSGSLNLNLAAFKKSEGTGLLLAEEGGARWNRGDYSGRLALGTWQSTGTTEAMDNPMRRGARGAYVVAEQTLWHASAGGQNAVKAFLQWGAAPAEFSIFVRHAGGGVIWNAPLRFRKNDVAGFSVASGEFGAPGKLRPGERETVWETFYRVQFMPRLSISPDFQYIAHPGGMPAHHLIAFGARVSISLLPRRE